MEQGREIRLEGGPLDGEVKVEGRILGDVLEYVDEGRKVRVHRYRMNDDYETATYMYSTQ